MRTSTVKVVSASTKTPRITQYVLTLTMAAVLGCALPTAVVADDTATLDTIGVRFTLPKGDNKDDNTRLAITVKKGSVAIAKNDNFADGDEFNDPGNYGPYSLTIQTKVTKADYHGSTTTLTITPQGGARHDTIVMNTIVDAKFSDGTVLTSESGTLRTVNAATTIFQNP